MSPLRFSGAPDPDEARRLYDRLLGAGLRATVLPPEVEEVARIACTHAPYLVALAARDVRRLFAAATDPYLRREKPREVMATELARLLQDCPDGVELGRRLRDYRAREFIRLGARECGLGDLVEVGRELAHLADVALDAAVRFHDAELARAHGEPFYEADDSTRRRAGLCVFGMGKLGGEELNFASDIDLVYVYPSDQGSAGALSLHEYFDKLARLVTRTIGEVTEDDVVFRVDLRLRPEGTRGPLVNSIPSLERYYETWGRPWERQAWLKARPVAGDLAVGQETLAVLAPFVYPRTLGARVVEDVRELNRRIKAELDRAGIPSGFDVKLGRGGIREIEFFVQALELVHAGKNPQLRERSTRRALEKLFFAGLVTDRERRALADAYDFLRHVEHLLQLEAGRQTHRLPTDFRRLGVLAARLGCADAGELASLLERHTSAVAEIFETLGADEGPRPEIGLLLDPSRPEAEQREALVRLGFRDLDDARFQLELLRRKRSSPFGPAATAAGARLAPKFLAEIAASPDPDQALRFLVDFVGSRGAWDGLWRLLDENPPLLRLVATLFGTSAYLARVFVERPELLDTLLLPGQGGPRRTRKELAHALDEKLADVRTDDVEAAWNALRRIKSEELLRIGMADIAGELDEIGVCEQLTDLADECVARAFAMVHAERMRRAADRGERLAPMTVLGLGKLGGRELSYASDLDLVFVYDGDFTDHEPMTKLAQRLVSALGAVLEEGRLYEVDTRLRPSGQKGTLVSSLGAWQKYHRSEAQLWERQALIKARAVAGDPALGRVVEREAERFVYEGEPTKPAAIAEAVLGMRERIEKELAHETGGSYDIKTGRGGLLDVEFAAQYLQLVHGPQIPALRVKSTLAALEEAARAGVIDDATRHALVGGYRFLRRLEHRMRMVHDRPIHELVSDPAELDKLARRTGYPSGTALERAYLAFTREVRACYLKILGAS